MVSVHWFFILPSGITANESVFLPYDRLSDIWRKLLYLRLGYKYPAQVRSCCLSGAALSKLHGPNRSCVAWVWGFGCNPYCCGGCMKMVGVPVARCGCAAAWPFKRGTAQGRKMQRDGGIRQQLHQEKPLPHCRGNCSAKYVANLQYPNYMELQGILEWSLVVIQKKRERDQAILYSEWMRERFTLFFVKTGPLQVSSLSTDPAWMTTALQSKWSLYKRRLWRCCTQYMACWMFT